MHSIAPLFCHKRGSQPTIKALMDVIWHQGFRRPYSNYNELIIGRDFQVIPIPTTLHLKTVSKAPASILKRGKDKFSLSVHLND